MAELWGPISASDWRSTPHIAGHPATEADVAAGFAVFYVSGESTAVSMSLPCCAYQQLEGGTEQPVVVIQAEIAPYSTVLGVRPLGGGNGICMETEIRLLDASIDLVMTSPPFALLRQKTYGDETVYELDPARKAKSKDKSPGQGALFISPADAR